MINRGYLQVIKDLFIEFILLVVFRYASNLEKINKFSTPDGEILTKAVGKVVQFIFGFDLL